MTESKIRNVKSDNATSCRVKDDDITFILTDAVIDDCRDDTILMKVPKMAAENDI